VTHVLRHVVEPPTRVVTLSDVRSVVQHHGFRLVDLERGEANYLVLVLDAPEMEPAVVEDDEPFRVRHNYTALMQARAGEVVERLARLDSYFAGHAPLWMSFRVQLRERR